MAVATGCPLLTLLHWSLVALMPVNAEHRTVSFSEIEDRIGYKFKSYENLEKALTHSSVRSKTEDHFHYERLEFLGDRVLGLCVAQILHERYPKANEGELSLRLNAVVRGGTLAHISDRIGLHEFIRTGGDLKTVKGKRMQSVRADVLEALIASIYLDGGLDSATQFIERFWTKRLNDTQAARRDSKTALQEWAHANQFGTPTYHEIDRTGPDHDPEFTVGVKVSDKFTMQGVGRSKRIAEQDAAKKLLVQESVWEEEAN